MLRLILLAKIFKIYCQNTYKLMWLKWQLKLELETSKNTKL